MTDEHQQDRRAMREVLMVTQAVADQQLVQTLAAGELEDFAANALMTDHQAYISRVFPLAIQRAKTLEASERKANPNKIGVSDAHAVATRLADEWKRWRQANPTPVEKRRAIRDKREALLQQLQASWGGCMRVCMDLGRTRQSFSVLSRPLFPTRAEEDFR